MYESSKMNDGNQFLQISECQEKSCIFKNLMNPLSRCLKEIHMYLNS